MSAQPSYILDGSSIRNTDYTRRSLIANLQDTGSIPVSSTIIIMEILKSITPEYQARLDQLAARLVLGRYFGDVSLQDTVEFEIPENIVLGQE